MLDPEAIHSALQRLPSAFFVLTCGHDGRRGGVLTRWAQQCSADPPLLVVALPKGRAIEPMIRDARAFAICMVPPGDRLAQRRFGDEADRSEDPFLALQTITAETGSPILADSLAWFDCRLAGHLSPEADARLYLGHVVAASVSPTLAVAPAGTNGPRHGRSKAAAAKRSAATGRRR